MNYESEEIDIITCQDAVENLRDIIAWSLIHGGLSVGQRILVHQKIANLLSIIETLRAGYIAPAAYQLPPVVEEKVQHIHSVIWNTGWERPEIKY